MSYYTDAARRAELDHRWSDAYMVWMAEGGNYAREQAIACKTIIEATELGDEFRDKVKDEYEKLQEHKITIYDYIKALNKAHDEIYIRG